MGQQEAYSGEGTSSKGSGTTMVPRALQQEVIGGSGGGVAPRRESALWTPHPRVLPRKPRLPPRKGELEAGFTKNSCGMVTISRWGDVAGDGTDVVFAFFSSNIRFKASLLL